MLGLSASAASAHTWTAMHFKAKVLSIFGGAVAVLGVAARLVGGVCGGKIPERSGVSNRAGVANGKSHSAAQGSDRTAAPHGNGQDVLCSTTVAEKPAAATSREVCDGAGRQPAEGGAGKASASDALPMTPLVLPSWIEAWVAFGSADASEPEDAAQPPATASSRWVGLCESSLVLRRSSPCSQRVGSNSPRPNGEQDSAEVVVNVGSAHLRMSGCMVEISPCHPGRVVALWFDDEETAGSWAAALCCAAARYRMPRPVCQEQVSGKAKVSPRSAPVCPPNGDDSAGLAVDTLAKHSASLKDLKDARQRLNDNVGKVALRNGSNLDVNIEEHQRRLVEMQTHRQRLQGIAGRMTNGTTTPRTLGCETPPPSWPLEAAEAGDRSPASSSSSTSGAGETSAEQDWCLMPSAAPSAVVGAPGVASQEAAFLYSRPRVVERQRTPSLGAVPPQEMPFFAQNDSVSVFLPPPAHPSTSSAAPDDPGGDAGRRELSPGSGGALTPPGSVGSGALDRSPRTHAMRQGAVTPTRNRPLADALDELLGDRGPASRSFAGHQGLGSSGRPSPRGAAAANRAFAERLKEQLERRRPSLEEETRRVMKHLEDAEALTQAFMKELRTPQGS